MIPVAISQHKYMNQNDVEMTELNFLFAYSFLNTQNISSDIGV